MSRPLQAFRLSVKNSAECRKDFSRRTQFRSSRRSDLDIGLGTEFRRELAALLYNAKA